MEPYLEAEARVNLLPTQQGGLEGAFPSPNADLLVVLPEGMLRTIIRTFDGSELVPGENDIPVILRFLVNEAWTVVKPCVKFSLWYGGIVGHGRVIRTRALPRADE